MKTLALTISLLFLLGIQAQAKDPFHVLLVDKDAHKLYVTKYSDEKVSYFLNLFHVTLGKVLGDKEVEKDLKTPEGIYYFKAKLYPPTLKKKFGVMAVMIGYPNPIDKRAGKTGYDIMLHSTDDPTRLKKDYDSEGCVVIDNDEIAEVSNYIHLGTTPLMIFSKMNEKDFIPSHNLELKNAFESWVKAWEGKDINSYIGTYSDDFVYNGMNLKNYRIYKNNLNAKYSKIKINPQNIRFLSHPKYDVVMFTQNYESELKAGKKGFKSSGTKYLYFVREKGTYKIAIEDYSNLRE